MAKFRKKPVVIEAELFTIDNWEQLEQVCGVNESGENIFVALGNWDKGLDKFVPVGGHVRTLEGTMTANFGDWIIKGVEGEFYPIKAEIFTATYEPVEGSENG